MNARIANTGAAVWFASVAGLVGLSSAVHGQCAYELTVIQGPRDPVFGAPVTVATGLNDLGHVVGYYQHLGPDDKAFVWTPESGLMTLNMLPGTLRSQAHDINSLGAIVGWIDIGGDGLDKIGFLYNGARLLEIRPPSAGTFSQANALDDELRIAGTTGDGTPYFKGFLWQNDVMTLIEPVFGPRSSANDINDEGVIVGWMGLTPETSAHPFRWQDGRIVDLGLLPGAFSGVASAISSSGEIVGSLWFRNPRGFGFLKHAFLWSTGEMVDLETLPGYERSQALDLNVAGQVVGNCSYPDPNDRRAFIWQDDTMVDLNELISSDAGIHVVLASAINDSGQIAGHGTNERNDVVAVLLTPAPIGDLSCDGHVHSDDFDLLLGAWGACEECFSCPADLDGDCNVGIMDLLILLANWGR